LASTLAIGHHSTESIVDLDQDSLAFTFLRLQNTGIGAEFNLFSAR
jgi:hypothetical protein